MISSPQRLAGSRVDDADVEVLDEQEDRGTRFSDPSGFVKDSLRPGGDGGRVRPAPDTPGIEA
jgi:hypothetical protein